MWVEFWVMVPPHPDTLAEEEKGYNIMCILHHDLMTQQTPKP